MVTLMLYGAYTWGHVGRLVAFTIFTTCDFQSLVGSKQ